MSQREGLTKAEVIGTLAGLEVLVEEVGGSCEIHWDTLRREGEEAHVDATVTLPTPVNKIQVNIDLAALEEGN